MSRFTYLTLALAGFTLAATPALAVEQVSPMVSFGAGYYDILDNEDDSADFRLEYRPGYEMMGFRSFIGAEATTHGSVWAGGGLLYDWKPTDNIYINPSFGVGLYAPGGADKDLDYPIEFRSQIEGGYVLESGSRVGLAFGHISNASLGDDNPGTEILNVYYHVPVNW